MQSLFCDQQTYSHDMYLGLGMWRLILAFQCLLFIKLNLNIAIIHDVYLPAELVAQTWGIIAQPRKKSHYICNANEFD